MRVLHKAEGFSLIELLAYFSIMAVIAGGMYSAFTYFTETKIEISQTAELQANTALSYNTIREQIRDADLVELVRLPASDTHCAIMKNLTHQDRRGLKFIGTGSSKNIMITGYRGPQAAASRTFMFWIRPVSLSTSPAITTMVGYGNDDTSANAGKRFEVYLNKTGDSFKVGVETRGAYVETGMQLPEKEWTHVAVVFDNSSGTVLTTDTTSIYINGNKDNAAVSGGNASLVVDTGNPRDIRIGGSFSNEFGTSANYKGAMAHFRIWEDALTSNEVRIEMASATSVIDEDRKADFWMTDNLSRNGGSHDMNTSNNFFSQSSYTSAEYPSFVDDFYVASALVFAKDSNSDFYKLFTTQSQSQREIDCEDPSLSMASGDVAKAGWREAKADNLWKWTAPATDNIFQYNDADNNTIIINADVTTTAGNAPISVTGDNIIVAGSQTRDREMCRLAPNIVGFNTGGENIGQMVITIDEATLESEDDELYFLDATKSALLTETIGGQSTSYYRYTNIKDEYSARSNSDIWPLITAKYYPQLGYIKVYTRASSAVNSAVDTMATKPIEDWERVMREVSYKNNAASYKDRKDFLFSLGPNIPCQVNNYIACRNAGDNDGDGNIETCYHWFNFIRFDQLGSDFSCWNDYYGGNGSESTYNGGHYDADAADCAADWENARSHASLPQNRLFGLNGYLATVTTAAEHTCSVDKINGAIGWLGASDRQCERNNSCGAYSGPLVSRDPAGEGKWYWVTGPEGEFNANTSGYSDHESPSPSSPQSNGRGHATYFGYDDNSGTDQFTERSIGSTTVDGQTYVLDAPFTKWANNEPNDWSWIDEDYLHTLNSGKWNDYTNFWRVQGYLIEYGGMQSDPDRRLVKKTSIDTFEFFKNCPPN